MTDAFNNFIAAVRHEQNKARQGRWIATTDGGIHCIDDSTAAVLVAETVLPNHTYIARACSPEDGYLTKLLAIAQAQHQALRHYDNATSQGVERNGMAAKALAEVETILRGSEES